MANREVFPLIGDGAGLAAGASIAFQKVRGTTYVVPPGYVLRILEMQWTSAAISQTYGPMEINTSAGAVIGGVPYGASPSSGMMPNDKYPVYISVPAGASINLKNNYSAVVYVSVRLLCMLEPVA